MKIRKFAVVVLAGMMAFSFAQADEITVDWEALNLKDDAAEAASAILEADVDAVLTMEENDIDEETKQEIHNENLLLIDCGKFGYNIFDMDGNGTPELFVVTNCPEDSYFGKMILEMYTQENETDFVPVFKSGERSAYYYCGGNKIAHIGSNGADVSVDTTYQYEDGKLTDLGTSADPSEYVQMDLETLGGEEEEDGGIQPMSSVDLSAEHLEDGDYSIGLELPRDADDSYLYAMVYDQNIYDPVDIGLMQAGDVLKTANGDILVKKVENADGVVTVNGGSDAGGAELFAEDESSCYVLIVDGKPVYELKGQAQLTLADTVKLNGTELPKGDIAEKLAEYGTELLPMNLTVRLENETVTEISATK